MVQGCRWSWAGIVTLGLLVAACGGGAPLPTHVVRDSAGVRLVENRQPLLDSTRSWRVGSGPVLAIGGEDGDSSAMLLQPVGAMRQGNGTIVVADVGALNLKYYDGSTGALTRTSGRKGRGPGEFEYFGYLWACGGDSAFVEDYGKRAVTVWAGDGTLVRSFALRGPNADQSFSTACNRRGDLLSSGWGDLRKQATGPSRPRVPVWFNTASGELAASLGVFPGTEMFGRVDEGYARRLGRWLRVAMGDSLGWVAPNENGDVRGYDTQGRLRVIVRQHVEEPAITGADRAWFDSLALDSAVTARERRAVQRELEEDDYPEYPPPVSAMVADVGGNVWVQPHPRAASPNPAWRVYRGDGVWLCTVVLPPYVHVLEIGDDYVLGLSTGDSGGRDVRVYALNKP